MNAIPTADALCARAFESHIFDLSSVTKLLTNNSRELAHDIGISPRELRRWMESREGKSEIARMQNHVDGYLDNACTRIIARCVSGIEDRVVNGDYRWNRNANDGAGEYERAQLSAITMAKIHALLFDRRQLLRNKPTEITRECESLDDLAKSLEGVSRMVSMTVVKQTVVKEEVVIENGESLAKRDNQIDD